MNKMFIVVAVIIIGLSAWFFGSYKSNVGVQNSPSPSSIVSSSPTPAPVGQSAYSGRPLAELKPSANVLKIYSKTKLDELKSRLVQLAAEDKDYPNDPVLWKEVGLIKNDIEDYTGARDAFEYWHFLSPRNSLALHNLAYLYAYHFNNKEKAETYLKEAISYDPDPMYYAQLADIYRYFFKDDKKVESIVLAGLLQNKNDLSLLAYLGGFYRDIGNIKAAIEYFEKLYALDPRPVIKDEIDRLKSQI